MTRLQTVLMIGLTALAVAGCGSSSSSSSGGSGSAAVQQGNAPVDIAFDDQQYPAACEKKMQTPNSKGAAMTAAQSTAFCGCVKQAADAKGLGQKSEQSITDAQFKEIYQGCETPAVAGATSSGAGGSSSSSGAGGSSSSSGAGSSSGSSSTGGAGMSSGSGSSSGSSGSST